MISTMFGLLETFFGLGLIAGPSVGGALYEQGGYILPFITVGILLLVAGCITIFMLPSAHNANDEEADNAEKKGMLDALKVPGIAVSAIGLLFSASSIGFLWTTLEPHLRQFDLTPLEMGLMFIINTGVYSVAAPFFGLVCDKFVNPIYIMLLGSILIMVGFTALGPAPFIPTGTIFSLCIAGLAIHGCGNGSLLCSSFAMARGQAVNNGFPDNSETNGLISGLAISIFAFGAFIGPVVAGILMEDFGFRYATLFIISFGVVVIIVSFGFLCGKRLFSQRINNKIGPSVKAVPNSVKLTKTTHL